MESVEDRVTWLNWVPWSFGENVMCGQAMVAHPLAPGARRGGRGRGPAASGAERRRRVANGVAHPGFFGVSGAFAADIRSGAVRLNQARGAAVREGEPPAETEERAIQLRLLHDSAVQPLEAVASGRFHDQDATSERAAREAAELEQELGRSRCHREGLDEMTVRTCRGSEGGRPKIDKVRLSPALPFAAARPSPEPAARR